jgi:hypothetical protein
MVTSGVPTNDDIIYAVLQKKNSDQNNDEYIDGTVTAKLLVT